MNRFRSIAVTAVAGFILVACGPAASESSSESLAGEASQAASEAAQASGDGVQPSFTEGAVAGGGDVQVRVEPATGERHGRPHPRGVGRAGPLVDEDRRWTALRGVR